MGYFTVEELYKRYYEILSNVVYFAETGFFVMKIYLFSSTLYISSFISFKA